MKFFCCFLFQEENKQKEIEKNRLFLSRMKAQDQEKTTSPTRIILVVFFLLELLVLDTFIAIVYLSRLRNSLVVSFLFGLQALHFLLPFAGIACLLDPLNKFAVLGAHASYILALFLDGIAFVLVLVVKNVFKGEVAKWALGITGSALALDGVVLVFITGYHIEVIKAVRRFTQKALHDSVSNLEADVVYFLPTREVYRLRRLFARLWVVAMILYLLFLVFFILKSILTLKASYAVLPSLTVLWSFPIINVLVGPGGKGTDPEPYIRSPNNPAIAVTYLTLGAGILGGLGTGIIMALLSSAFELALLPKIMFFVSFVFLMLSLVCLIIMFFVLPQLQSELAQERAVKKAIRSQKKVN